MTDPMPPAPRSNDAYGAPAAGGTAGRRNPLAITSLVLGIVGMFVSFYGIVGLVALILGIVGRRQLLARGERGNGMAIAGIVLGAVGVVLGILAVVGLSIYGGMRH